MPVFWFGISQVSNIHATVTIVVFVALHLFIYPASNLYNSYMDEDKGAIGGLEHPPPVTREMYYVSILVDVTGLLICSLAGWPHLLVLAGYICFSKAYSWHGIRLKKMPILGWLSVMFFQGGYTYMLGNMAAMNDVSLTWFTAPHLEGMLIASLIIGGSYPLTQIYQHDEDGERGDFTISYRLGIRGTFLFTAAFFTLGALAAYHYFIVYYSLNHFLVFLGCLSPVIGYFTWWMLQSWRDKHQASFRNAMRMNKISALCMVICFTVILWMNSA